MPSRLSTTTSLDVKAIRRAKQAHDLAEANLDNAIKTARRNGAKLREIADAAGVTAARIQQITGKRGE